MLASGGSSCPRGTSLWAVGKRHEGLFQRSEHKLEKSDLHCSTARDLPSSETLQMLKCVQTAVYEVEGEQALISAAFLPNLLSRWTEGPHTPQGLTFLPLAAPVARPAHRAARWLFLPAGRQRVRRGQPASEFCLAILVSDGRCYFNKLHFCASRPSWKAVP